MAANKEEKLKKGSRSCQMHHSGFCCKSRPFFWNKYDETNATFPNHWEKKRALRQQISVVKPLSQIEAGNTCNMVSKSWDSVKCFESKSCLKRTACLESKLGESKRDMKHEESKEEREALDYELKINGRKKKKSLKNESFRRPLFFFFYFYLSTFWGGRYSEVKSVQYLK